MPESPLPPNPSANADKRPLLLHWRDRLFKVLFGPARDPMAPETHRHITLIAFLAWVGLGADGLSSSAYGPEEAFKALGEHTGLALFLAIAMAMTVFVISVSYNQVIELFPTGGGGYKVATRLLGRRAGLVSGSALVVDYMLTIAISIAAGVDALFSFLPPSLLSFKLEVKILCLVFLVVLNLRGVKESIKFLLPLFMGFVLTHVFLILYGIARHAERVTALVPDSLADVSGMSRDMGLLFVMALFMRAYAMGGGTYTGIEAVSNSVNLLKEPRVRTGKWTMFYMALSLSFTAGGIILLYLLWSVTPIEGQTLNAVAFSAILADWPFWGGWSVGQIFLVITLVFEAGLLFVAANTGFLGGPATLANMAVDHWVPHRFSQLSDRLVTKNGILLMGGSAFAVLLWSRGLVDLLVVLYSINVFLTFTMTLMGLCVYWWHNRVPEVRWRLRLALSVWGLLVTSSILVIILVEKFFEGGWITALVTNSFIGLCWLVYSHYFKVGKRLTALDDILTRIPVATPTRQPPPVREGEPAAVFFVSSYRGVGIHTLLNSQRLFPGRFHNFVFLSVGEVDTTRMKGDHTLADLKHQVDESLHKYVQFCHAHNMAAVGFSAFGTDPVEAAVKLADDVLQRFPGSVFFAGTLVFREENWMTRLLHNHTALAIQRQLHIKGMPLVIMPMQVDTQ
jgi:amino acid transporter